MNNKQTLSSKIINYCILFVSIVVVMLFIYGLIKVSFQTGDNSARITQTIAYRAGLLVLKEQPTMEQIATINRFIRYSAHIGLFALLGYMIGIVLFMINRTYTMRLIAILFDWAITFGLSYFTEYYKRFIAGRHFQMEDVRANMAGSLFGICFFILSHILFMIIFRRTKFEKF